MNLPSRALSEKFLRFIGWILFAYVAFIAVLYLTQRRMVFPARHEHVTPAEMSVPQAKIVLATTSDGLVLSGWYIPPVHPNGRVFVVFHGNADQHAFAARSMAPYIAAGDGVLLTEYRGYAGDAGTPSEDGLYKDGRAWLKWLAATGVAPYRTVLYGQSIGTGVAVQMALEFPEAQALILQSPFTTLPDVAQNFYWFVPVRFLMRDKFDNIDKIAKLKMPLLVIYGTADRIVPPAESVTLYSAAPVLKSLAQVNGYGHNNIPPNVAYERVETFLARVTTTGVRR